MNDYKIAAIKAFLKKRNIFNNLQVDSPTNYQLLSINKIPIYAKVASTPEQLATGLMFVDSLDPNQGCLLSFGQNTYANLYMKNCKINLQAAMIDSQGKITDIVNMYFKDPYYIHKSSSPIKYALEMSESFFTHNNIKVGDLVKHL